MMKLYTKHTNMFLTGFQNIFPERYVTNIFNELFEIEPRTRKVRRQIKCIRKFTFILL